MSDSREPQQRCGTCRWWRRAVATRTELAPCDVPIPSSIAGADTDLMYSDDGTTCPTWALRTTNKEQNHD